MKCIFGEKAQSPLMLNLVIHREITRSLTVLDTYTYGGADNSLARPTSQCILFDGQNISFDTSPVIHINSTNIPPIVIINKIYETENLLSM
jgi:hypothetical protein